jgi:hypothetical protein
MYGIGVTSEFVGVKLSDFKVLVGLILLLYDCPAAR